MENNILICYYNLSLQRRNTIYSAGSDLFFSNPCIGYIKKGYAEFLYNGKSIYACEGDLIYISYQTKYQSIWHGDPDIEWYSVNFDFNSKYAFYDYRFQILKNYPPDIFEKMYKTYADSPMISVSCFYRLLDDIYNKMKSTPQTAAYSMIEPALRFMEKNYQQRISVKTLANLCKVSESGFFKLFKKETGVTPIAYKHNIMIQHSVELLSNTSMPIEEISSAAGFPSSNYFRKVFFRLTGKMPGEFRSKNSSNTPSLPR